MTILSMQAGQHAEFTFTQAVTAIKEYLEATLNPSALSSDSIEGWIVLFICLVITYKITKNAGDFIGWLIGLLFIIQLGYWLGQTKLDDIVPLSQIFKYDILAAVAQCFAGTRICDALLYVDAFIRNVADIVFRFFDYIAPHATDLIRDIMKNAG